MLKKQTRPIPPPPPFKKILGPSFILLGLGLGSGEVILWPYLSSNFGLGIAWGACLGILFQFFINMEIERYALARGESVFIGLARRWGWAPYWLIFSTLIGFGWPGIIASSAYLFTSIFGGTSTYTAIILLVVIGLIISAGKYIYKTVERFSTLIILLGVPAVFLLTLALAHPVDWLSLGQGLFGKGEGYWFLPVGVPLVSFLAAFAYSGAGGNLNLTQSSYIREKGYGMGYFAPKIKGLFTGRKQMVDLNGYTFDPTKKNLATFHAWWHKVNIEHFLVFFLTGLLTMLFLLLLSYVTTFGTPGNSNGIAFVVAEAKAIGARTLPLFGSLFALAMGIMLFSTQFSVMDSTSRIMSENFVAIRSKGNMPVNVSRVYYACLWAQITFGIIIFALGLKEPLTLLIVGASINAVCMLAHIALVNIMNYKELPKEIHPALGRKIVLAVAFLFFATFSGVTVWDKILSRFF